MKALVRFALLASVVALVLLLRGGSHASDPFAVAVANAATSCPEGFAVTVQGLPAGSQPTSSLSDSCVLALGIPAGAAGAPGSTGATGPAGTAGTNGIGGLVETTNYNSSKSNVYKLAATAKCSAGKQAIGGGASVTSGKGRFFAVTTSQPTSNGQGWVAEATNYNSSKSNTATTLKRSQSNTTNYNSSKSNLTVTAVCAVVGN